MRIRIREERGASALEFALVFPLALAFFSVILFLGLHAFAAATADNAARDGARFASIRTGHAVTASYPDAASVQARVADRTPGFFPEPEVEVSPETTVAATGELVTVTVTYPQVGFLGAAQSLLGAVGLAGDTEVSRSVTVRRE